MRFFSHNLAGNFCALPVYLVKLFWFLCLSLFFLIASNLIQHQKKSSTWNSHSEITAAIMSAFCLSFNFALQFFKGISIIDIFLRSSIFYFYIGDNWNRERPKRFISKADFNFVRSHYIWFDFQSRNSCVKLVIWVSSIKKGEVYLTVLKFATKLGYLWVLRVSRSRLIRHLFYTGQKTMVLCPVLSGM